MSKKVKIKNKTLLIKAVFIALAVIAIGVYIFIFNQRGIWVQGKFLKEIGNNIYTGSTDVGKVEITVSPLKVIVKYKNHEDIYAINRIDKSIKVLKNGTVVFQSDNKVSWMSDEDKRTEYENTRLKLGKSRNNASVVDISDMTAEKRGNGVLIMLSLLMFFISLLNWAFQDFDLKINKIFFKEPTKNYYILKKVQSALLFFFGIILAVLGLFDIV